MTMSLNISMRQLRDPALPTLLSDAIRVGELDPAAIYLEVAETALAADPDTAIRALEAVKATGARIVIDDFGTGALPLSRLIQFPLDAIKIHESFVAGLSLCPENASLVGALVELGHALG